METMKLKPIKLLIKLPDTEEYAHSIRAALSNALYWELRTKITGEILRRYRKKIVNCSPARMFLLGVEYETYS